MNWNEGRTGGGFPFRWVSLVTAGGVKNWNTDLSTSVTFYGVGNWVFFIGFAANTTIIRSLWH